MARPGWCRHHPDEGPFNPKCSITTRVVVGDGRQGGQSVERAVFDDMPRRWRDDAKPHHLCACPQPNAILEVPDGA
jgi:hypothetical protein